LPVFGRISAEMTCFLLAFYLYFFGQIWVGMVRNRQKDNSQFIISTHSPILMTYPHAEIFEIKDGKLLKTRFEETEHYQITKYFMNCPQKMLQELGIKTSCYSK
jgi:hypothetical protein